MFSQRLTSIYGCIGRFVQPLAMLPLTLGLALATGLRAETIQYDVTFDATWSAAMHPYDFPSNPHFSGLIGGTHNASVNFWTPGGIASQGIENMAELGSKTPLNDEVQAAIAAGTAYSLIDGGGIRVSPASVGTRFDISADFPLVSLVSMIAPSPDWFVGVHDLNMREGGEWIGKLVVELWPYDAGTDGGVTFASPDLDTDPQIPIALLDGFPFEGTPPLGTFTFVRVLAGDYNRSGTWDVDDIDDLTQAVRTGDESGKFDLDGNSLVDDNDRVYWVKSLRTTYFGDANLDGQFNSTDLITVLAAGEYEAPLAGNSSWATGDWTGDGKFTSSDLVRALQDGGYEGGAAAVAQVVPEPTHLSAMALVALLAMRRSARREAAR